MKKISIKSKGNFKIIYIITSIFVVSLFLFWLIYFKYFRNKDFSEWISLMATIISTISGGYLTMLGVVFSLKRTEENENKKYKKEIKQKAYIVYEELNAYLESVLDLNIKLLNYHIKFYWSDKEMNGHSKILEYNCIYEPISNIKELFYEVVNFYPNVDKKYIKAFVNFNKDYSRTKQIKSSRDEISIRVNNLGIESFNDIFLNNRADIYMKLDYETYKLYKKEYNDCLESDAQDKIALMEYSTVYSKQIKELLDFLKEI